MRSGVSGLYWPPHPGAVMTEKIIILCLVVTTVALSIKLVEARHEIRAFEGTYPCTQGMKCWEDCEELLPGETPTKGMVQCD